MKSLSSIFIFSLFLANVSFSQTPPPPPPPPPSPPKADEIFKVVELMAMFPGCEEDTDKRSRQTCATKKMNNFVFDNLKYPAIAKENGVQGIVVVSFIVEKDGSLSDCKIVRDIGAGCGDEALRIVSKMPKWNPAAQRDRPVRCLYNLPVSFNIKGYESHQRRKLKREKKIEESQKQ